MAEVRASMLLVANCFQPPFKGGAHIGGNWGKVVASATPGLDDARPARGYPLLVPGRAGLPDTTFGTVVPLWLCPRRRSGLRPQTPLGRGSKPQLPGTQPGLCSSSPMSR